MGAMLADDKRRRPRQIEYLAGTVTDGHLQRHGRSTGRARWRNVVDDIVGRGDLLQGLALMSLLAARRLVRWSAQALGPGGARRFFEPVARRRLAAVRTVQPEPPLKLGDPRLQTRDLRRLRRDHRNQLFTRRLALRIRIRTHRILESKADSAVEKNLPAQPPRHATINLGSYQLVYHDR